MEMNNSQSLKKAVAYMRYSSKNQNNVVYGHMEANTIETQREAINRCAQQYGYEIVHEYIDEAYTGRNDKRPGFQKMMADAQNNPNWKYVICYKHDRIARNALIGLDSEAQLNDLGITVKSAENYVDNEDSNSNFCKTIYYAIAEQFSINLSSNTYNGMRNKSLSAAHCGGIPPLGYDIDEHQHLCINKREAEAVKQIYKMYLEGESYSEIAKNLNEKGYTTKSGKAFTKNSFVSILKQEKYTGTYIWNKRAKKKHNGKRNNSACKPREEQTIINDGCPVIISKEVFDKVQEAMKQRKQSNTHASGKTRRNYMLSGLKILKCAECGAYLIGIADKTHGKEYIRYRCPNHKNNKCSTKDIRAEALNEYVAKLIVYKLFPKNALNKTNEMLAKADMSKELMKKRKITISAILQLTNNLEKVTSEALSNKLKEREDELKQIEIQIKKLKHLRITDEKAYRKIRSRIVKMLMNPNYDLRCLIASIVEEITIGNETIEVTLKM